MKTMQKTRISWLALAIVALAAISGAANANTYYVSPSGRDDNPGTDVKPWKTFGRSTRILSAGDTLIVGDGAYSGVLRVDRSGLPGNPITVKAAHVGRAVIDAKTSPLGMGIRVFHSNNVVIDGFYIKNGDMCGVYVAQCINVTVRNCIAEGNLKWGIFSAFSDDLLIERNMCAFNSEQHGIYLSNGGDRPIVRYNVCHDNGRSGIQLNGDGKFVRKDLGTRGDGVINNADINHNVCFNNGKLAAAAINLASVSNSKISDNLVYNNYAGGIAMFSDNNVHELQWGCKNNVIQNNTVFFRPNEGRWCISLARGSTGNNLSNNILCGGARGAYECDDTSSFNADYNLLFSQSYKWIAVKSTDQHRYTPEEWTKLTGIDDHSNFSAPKFTNSLGPNPDFHLSSDSPAIGAGSSSPGDPTDLDGLKRLAGPVDLGCYSSGNKGGGGNRNSAQPDPGATPPDLGSGSDDENDGAIGPIGGDPAVGSPNPDSGGTDPVPPADPGTGPGTDPIKPPTGGSSG